MRKGLKIDVTLIKIYLGLPSGMSPNKMARLVEGEYNYEQNARNHISIAQLEQRLQHIEIFK